MIYVCVAALCGGLDTAAGLQGHYKAAWDCGRGGRPLLPHGFLLETMQEAGKEKGTSHSLPCAYPKIPVLCGPQRAGGREGGL